MGAGSPADPPDVGHGVEEGFDVRRVHPVGQGYQDGAGARPGLDDDDGCRPHGGRGKVEPLEVEQWPAPGDDKPAREGAGGNGEGR